MTPPIGGTRGGVRGLPIDTSSLPDSVVYQYRVEDFASPWPDTVGSADMSVNGMVTGTFSNGEDAVFGDGADDYGLADGPQNLPQNETFGIGFTFESTDTTDLSNWFGAGVSTNTSLKVYDTDATDGQNGDINFRVVDNDGNILECNTNDVFTDGNPHLVVINKNGNSAEDIDFYVDDMTSPVASTIQNDQAFDHTNYSTTTELAFYAENDAGTIQRYKEYDAGIFEFNSEPYVESERTGLANRRPEV